ncbi:MAG TPA: acetamidase/formamidase family protein [Coxiellaceae bacterium]|nr:MAG: hypothetical protein A3E81_05330 [Gammaproteobacteria bacterium RIFCSPHIGHO2_12_FULL_36_30]HLB57033.1 acetamidase/formamidase family protein [Coxiellaceae bacterium]
MSFKRQCIILFSATLTSTIIAHSAFAESVTKNCLPYLSTAPDQTSMRAPKKTADQKNHTYVLPATPATTQWGFFDTSHPPVLHIQSGDTVVIETMAASDNTVVPGGANIDQIIKMSHEVPNRGPHTLTGPIYVNGAEPGDVLKIHINKIIPRPYASNDIVPGKGLFPNIFTHSVVKYFYLDLKNMTMQFAPGIVIPLGPFPGIIAVAPQIPGKYNSSPPGPFGGNMDLRELKQGTTLYLPVFQKGALLWSGDSHAGQGNGEIDLTAIETAFAELSLTIDVVKNHPLTWPRIQTNSAWIAMGYDKDINKALSITIDQSIKLIMDKDHATKSQAEKILFSSWNCPISEVVDGLNGTYCIIPNNKNAKPFPLPSKDTATNYVTVGKNTDLMEAMKIASMAMINKISALKKMQPVDVYMLASLAMDCRIAPYHSGDKEVHCMLAKNLWV